jgi:hypothetical protein
MIKLIGLHFNWKLLPMKPINIPWMYPKVPIFVHEKVLQLFCTETVFVECEIEQDTISSMKVVAENLHPQKTIVIRFTQNSEDRKKISSELKVKNPFQKSLVYDAMMFTPNSQDWQSTSIIPIQPQLENYELGHMLLLLWFWNVGVLSKYVS